MNRKNSLCIMLLLLCAGLAGGHAESQERPDADSPVQIEALRQERLRLLEERVTLIKTQFAEGLVDQTLLVPPEMDLINARLEYARSDAERKQLLSDLLEKYDWLIDRAKTQAKAQLRQSGPLEVLFLKSERIRVQIQLASLEQPESEASE
jgi:hypothetical protein